MTWLIVGAAVVVGVVVGAVFWIIVAVDAVDCGDRPDDDFEEKDE